MIDGAKTHDDIEMASEHSFALVFAGFLANVGCWPLIHGHSLRLWALAIAAAFFVLGLWRPSVLRPFNVVWFKLSRLLANPRTQVAIIAGLMMPRRSRRSITLNVSDWTEPFSGVVTPIVMGLLCHYDHPDQPRPTHARQRSAWVCAAVRSQQLLDYSQTARTRAGKHETAVLSSSCHSCPSSWHFK